VPPLLQHLCCLPRTHAPLSLSHQPWGFAGSKPLPEPPAWPASCSTASSNKSWRDEPSRASAIGYVGHKNACDACFPLVPASGPIPRRGCCCTGSLLKRASGDDKTVLWWSTHDSPMGLQSGWAVWAVLPMTSGADCDRNLVILSSQAVASTAFAGQVADHIDATRPSCRTCQVQRDADNPGLPRERRPLSSSLQIYPITGQWGFAALNGKRPDQRATSVALAMATSTSFDGTTMAKLLKAVYNTVCYVSCGLGRVRMSWPDERTSQETASCRLAGSINHAEGSVVAL